MAILKADMVILKVDMVFLKPRLQPALRKQQYIQAHPHLTNTTLP
jgi:hypothetical protein